MRGVSDQNGTIWLLLKLPPCCFKQTAIDKLGETTIFIKFVELGLTISFEQIASASQLHGVAAGLVADLDGSANGVRGIHPIGAGNKQLAIGKSAYVLDRQTGGDLRRLCTCEIDREDGLLCLIADIQIAVSGNRKPLVSICQIGYGHRRTRLVSARTSFLE
ncbi:hypothetical protein SDC9_80936 [bioreactor metagenome]|uniref:Uncharacterized protein n=1 Tax=bioreactor metagenome TaxID=1076179 RepID=A0A644Z8R3_9ZZZZ